MVKIHRVREGKDPRNATEDGRHGGTALVGGSIKTRDVEISFVEKQDRNHICE